MPALPPEAEIDTAAAGLYNGEQKLRPCPRGNLREAAPNLPETGDKA